MKAFVIAGTNVRRLLRDRSNIFFVFIFPMLLILVIGATFGGGFTPRIAVVGGDDGELAAEIVAELSAVERIEVVGADNRADALEDVERGRVNAALVIPAGYDGSVTSGSPAELEFMARQDDLAQQLRAIVDAVAADQRSRLGAAAAVVAEAGLGFEESLAAVDSARAVLPGVSVESSFVGEAVFDGDVGRFDLGASQQLLLFTFLTSLAGSAALIQTRMWGVSRRMLSTPTSTGEILVGETLGRFGVALVQSVFIMIGSLVVFGVNWGNPLGAIALVVLFSLVGSGAGMLAGSIFSNDQQAGSIGVFAGLGLAALGGCMVPLEVFSDTMQQVAHITPHAWALDGFAELIRRGGTIVDILPELGVLAAFAVGLLAIATVRLRHVLTA